MKKTSGKQSRTIAFERAGKGKQWRWRCSFHEACHGLACAYLLHRSADLFVYSRGGGLCCLRGKGGAIDPGPHGIYALAGDIGTAMPDVPSFVECHQIPRGRFRHVRRPRRHEGLPNDEKCVEGIMAASEALRVPEIAAIAHASWTQQATTFVVCHRREITAIAIELYLHGHIRVPAKSEHERWASEFDLSLYTNQAAADVLPGQ